MSIADSQEWYAEVPRSITRHVVFGLTLMAVSFGGFGVWAFRAPLAAAVIAQGSFVATGQNKIVQHLEGGIIDAIMVREGDTVRAGDPLVRLDQTTAEANERELHLRQVRLQAMEARLAAENAGKADLVFPEALTALAEDHEIAAILDGQRLAFEVARNALANDLAVLERNIEALSIRSSGYAAQLVSHERQIEILEEDFEIKEQLFEQGLIRKSQMVAVERMLVEADGQRSRLQAEIAEIAETQARYDAQIEQARSEHGQAALDELQSVQADLDSVREQARKAENVLYRAVVAAPVDGIVVRMFYHTAGGVVESGKPIVEIVPSDAALIVEVALSEVDIDAVRLGQEAAVRLTALNQRTTPVLVGTVDYISADKIDDRGADGQAREIYIVRVSVAAEEQARADGFEPTPGMPAQVMIQTEERTFAQYLAKPILDSMSRAFKEQ